MPAHLKLITYGIIIAVTSIRWRLLESVADVDGRKSQNQGAAGTLQAMVQRCTVTNGTQPIELIL